MKTINIKSILYVSLFFACFNDLLRIGNSDFSFFRIILPLVWLIIIKNNFKKLEKPLIVFLLFTILFFVQNWIFYRYNEFGLIFTLSRFFKYLLLAFFIFTIYCVVDTIANNSNNKTIELISFADKMSWIILFVFVLAGVINYSYIKNLITITNINNYSMYLCAYMPFHIKKVLNDNYNKSKIFILLSIIGMYVNDCKLSIIGVAIEMIVMLFIINKSKKTTMLKKIRNLILSFASIVLIVLFINGKVSIHNNDYYTLIQSPLEHIVSGELYNTSNTSLRYRTNIYILAIKWINKTHLIGIGYGNAGLIMREELGYFVMKDSFYTHDSVSLHNAILEFILEFGFIAVILIGVYYVNVFKILKKEKLEDIEIIKTTFALSMPLWIIGPANLNSSYFFFIILFLLLKSNNNYIKKEN